MNSPSRRISYAFTGIVLFVTSQLIWWNIFFSRYTNDVTKRTKEQWKLEQRMLRATYPSLSPTQQAQLRHQCTTLQPHIQCTPPLFSIKPTAYHALLREKRRYQRMFLFEGCFFFLVFLGGLFLLWMGIRSERELKHRQQNFFSAVSHEMRTPISTMRLLLETLQMRKVSPEKQAKYFDRLHKQVERLQHTSEQVVAAAMLDTSRSKRNLTSGDLNEQVEAVMAITQSDLEDRGARVTWTPSPTPVPVKVDPAALSLVLNNLLENAIKYNDKEDKQIDVSVTQQGAWAHLSVIDNGPGISLAEQEKVFTPFYRVGEELTREKDGLGLGLYLVKGLTQAMQGNVQYKALEPGSAFTLKWPIAPDESKLPSSHKKEKGTHR
jgi:signal transduction histidine kinase